MAYTVTIADSGSYIRLVHWGKISIEELEQGREVAISALESAKLERLVVDKREMVTDLTMMQHFSFTASHVGKLPEGLKTAVLVRPDYAEKAGFVRDVATNRNINLKIFTTEYHAQAWLKMP